MAIDEERFERLESAVGKIVSRIEGSGGKDNEDDSDNRIALDRMSDSEVEQLTRREFAKMLTDSISKKLGSLEKTVGERLDDTRGEFSKAQIKAELQEVAGRHPEIQYLREELKAMMREHPDLSVQRMVNLIKAEQPEKYQEAVGKHEEAQKGGKEGDDDKEGEDGKDGDKGKESQDDKTAGEKGGGSKDNGAGKGTGAGGLPPGGAGGGAGDDGGKADSKLSTKEAGATAFQELFGDKETLS